MSVSVQFRVRLIAALMEPAIRVAHRLCIPADELVDLLLTEYVRHQIEEGFSFTAIARRMGMSRRKVAYLAKAAKSPSNLLSDSTHFALRRRIATWFAEREEPVVDFSEIERSFKSTSDQELARAIEALVESEVLEFDEGVYRLSSAFMSTVDRDPGPIVDAVRHLVQALSFAVEHRFLDFPRRVGTARTLSFSLPASKAKTTLDGLYNMVRERVIELDEESDGELVTIFWGGSADVIDADSAQ